MSAPRDNDDVVLLRPEHEPVPESDPHERQVDMFAAGLRSRFADRQDVAVHCRLAWFPVRADTRIRLDPDVMIAFGRPKQARTSYRTWDEEGVNPQVLVEVLSPGDSPVDYTKRLDRAMEYDVEEMILIAPQVLGGVSVEHLVADRSAAPRWALHCHSASPDEVLSIERLDITIAGGPTLVVRNIDGGEPWPETHELFARAMAESQRADVESQRASRLAQALRDAGIDPDSIP